MRSPFSPPAPRLHVLLLAFAALALRLFAAEEAPSVLVPVRQNNPGLIVDLGTGLWPSPRHEDRPEVDHTKVGTTGEVKA